MGQDPSAHVQVSLNRLAVRQASSDVKWHMLYCKWLSCSSLCTIEAHTVMQDCHRRQSMRYGSMQIPTPLLGQPLQNGSLEPHRPDVHSQRAEKQPLRPRQQNQSQSSGAQSSGPREEERSSILNIDRHVVTPVMSGSSPKQGTARSSGPLSASSQPSSKDRKAVDREGHSVQPDKADDLDARPSTSGRANHTTAQANGPAVATTSTSTSHASQVCFYTSGLYIPPPNRLYLLVYTFHIKLQPSVCLLDQTRAYPAIPRASLSCWTQSETQKSHACCYYHIPYKGFHSRGIQAGFSRWDFFLSRQMRQAVFVQRGLP